MKKKIFAIAAALMAAVTTLSTTAFAEEAGEAASEGGFNFQWIIMIGIYAVVIGGAYFLLFRPQSKKKKKEAALRRNAQIGDEITTIGGIHGRIVAVKEESDTIVLETGTDRTRMTIKRWAISSVDTPNGAPAEDKSAVSAKESRRESKKLKEAKEEVVAVETKEETDVAQ